MKLLFLIPPLLILLQACASEKKDNFPKTEGFLCEKYLIDTGYNLEKNEDEKYRIYLILKDKMRIEDKFSKFDKDYCVGSLKNKNETCYLALPVSQDNDGDLSNCPKSVLK